MTLDTLERPGSRADRSRDFEYLSREVRGIIDPEELERIAESSVMSRTPVPIYGSHLFTFDGKLVHQHELAPPGDPVFGMAGFSNYDQIISALSSGASQSLDYQKNTFTTVAGQVHDYWLAAGAFPAAGAFGTALTGTVPTSATVGSVVYSNTSGGRFMYLVSCGAFGPSAAIGTLLVYDRVAEYPFNGTVTSGTWTTQPALTRDANGASLGDGVYMFAENVGATANAAVNLTVTYTNSGGTGSRSTGAQALVVGATSTNRIVNPAGQPWFPLASGDFGVRSLQSYVLSATATSTTMNLVLARPFCYIPILANATMIERDMVLQIPALPRVYDNTAFSFLLIANTTSAAMNANLRIAQN